MIVQSWRSAAWKKADTDSILILTFAKTLSGGRVDLVHVDVPEHDHKGVTRGWTKLLLGTMAHLSCGRPTLGKL
jgi:hypothetical protein